MKVVKSLFPIVVLMIAAFYGYQKYDQLPLSATIGVTYLSHALAIIVIGLSIRFSRSSLFFYVLLVVLANMILRFGWAGGDLGYGLLSALLPLLLVMVTVLPDRGIISIKALPTYAIILLSGVFAMAVVLISPDWASSAVLSDWLPVKYFDWTTQSQTVLGISFASLYILLTLSILNPSLHRSAGFGVLLMMIAQLHFGADSRSLIGADSRSLNVFGSAALMMCLYAIMQETWRMAYLDELTGLPGRRALSEKFQKISGTYIVAMLDVDHFKHFNDSYGHDAGDAVLRMIAAKMTRVGGGGMPFRYGGEEFSILFAGKTSREAVRHLDALREEIANKPFIIRRPRRKGVNNPPSSANNKSVQVTVSIGFADSSGNKGTAWDVLKLSDQALYRAKGKGRNCISE